MSFTPRVDSESCGIALACPTLRSCRALSSVPLHQTVNQHSCIERPGSIAFNDSRRTANGVKNVGFLPIADRGCLFVSNISASATGNVQIFRYFLELPHRSNMSAFGVPDFGCCCCLVWRRVFPEIALLPGQSLGCGHNSTSTPGIGSPAWASVAVNISVPAHAARIAVRIFMVFSIFVLKIRVRVVTDRARRNVCASGLREACTTSNYENYVPTDGNRLPVVCNEGFGNSPLFWQLPGKQGA
jgi:hypothetical protein